MSREVGLTFWAIGDSITFGFGLSDITNRWADTVNKRLNDYRQMYYLNQGHTGYETWQLLPIVQPRAQAIYSDIVTILLGTNDIGKNSNTAQFQQAIYDNLYKMIKTIQGTKRPGQVRIFLCTLIPRFDGVVLTDANIKIRQLATDMNLPLVELSNILPNATYTSDNVHPTPEGHSLIADAVWSVILADKDNWVNLI